LIKGTKKKKKRPAKQKVITYTCLFCNYTFDLPAGRPKACPKCTEKLNKAVDGNSDEL
jgi:rubrerythrin